MKNNDTNKFVDIVNAIGEPEFCHCLLAYFQHFIEFDSASAIHYRKDHVPELLYADLTPSEQTIFHARFLHGAYVASPAYQAYMQHACGTACIRNSMHAALHACGTTCTSWRSDARLKQASKDAEDFLGMFIKCLCWRVYRESRIENRQ